MSPPRPSRLVVVALGLLVALQALTTPLALAAEDAVPAAGEPGPGKVLAIVALAILFALGIACLVAVLRVVFPGPVRKADGALQRLSTGRLLLTGILPVVGLALLAMAAEATHVEALVIVYAFVLVLPALLLMILGALAAIPHLGGALLKSREDRSLLSRCVVGTLALGLALGASAALKPLIPFVGVIVAGWFLGAGLGVIFRPASPQEVAPEL